MIKIVELFSGIGAIRKALINLEFEHKVLFFSEINKNAIDAYRGAIFQDYKFPNLGDVSKITNQ